MVGHQHSLLHPDMDQRQGDTQALCRDAHGNEPVAAIRDGRGIYRTGGRNRVLSPDASHALLLSRACR